MQGFSRSALRALATTTLCCTSEPEHLLRERLEILHQIDELCLNESCHHLTRDDLYELTADMGTYNPHWAHHEELECTTCHKAHRASVMYRTQCHAQAEVPEGWLSMAESNNLPGVKAPAEAAQ